MILLAAKYYIFLITILVLLIVTPINWRKHLLTLSSLFFYIYLEPKYTYILALIIVTLWFYTKIQKRVTEQIRSLLSFAIILGFVSILLSFKILVLRHFTHFSFLTSNTTSLVTVLIPIGISFYMFRAIAYIVSLNQGRLTANLPLVDISLYMLYFPQIASGPLEEPERIISQFDKIAPPDTQTLFRSCLRIMFGVFKKVVLADNLFPLCSEIFKSPQEFGLIPMMGVTFLFFYFIYLDLSSYTDIVIGSSQLFGIALPENFRRPFQAKSPTDFWRRYHISAVQWFYLYVFVPVARKLNTKAGIQAALFLSLTAMGIWHIGDIWYVLWGATQGALLIVCHQIYVRPWFKNFIQSLNGKALAFMGLIVTQIIVCVPYFTAQSMRIISSHGSAYFLKIISNPISIRPILAVISTSQPLIISMLIVILPFLEFTDYFENIWSAKKEVTKKEMALIFVLLIVAIIFFGNFNGRVFNYVQY